MKKTSTTLNYQDKWSSAKVDLADLASSQVTADIEVVEARRALELAQARFDKALAHQTTADKKLANARRALGGE